MLTRPVILKILPFDAITDFIVRFNVVGGDQIFGTNLVIRNNATNLVVYDKTIESFKFEHTIPKNTLINGQSYNVKIRTKNRNGEFSEFSDVLLFQCYSDAIVKCDNVINGIINNQTYMFHFTYSQTEGINIQSYKVFLYDEHEILIAQSEALKNTTNLQYEFTNLQNNKVGFVECKVLNQVGVESTSGKVKFISKYVQPRMANTLKLHNDFNNASVKADIKVIQVLFKELDGEISFEDNEWINLKNGSIYTDYENGLDLKGNWTLKIFVKSLEEDKKIMRILLDNEVMSFTMYDNRVHLYKQFKNIYDYKIHIASNRLDDIKLDDIICIWVQNVDGNNNIKIEKINS